jgi:hypothetical protein
LAGFFFSLVVGSVVMTSLDVRSSQIDGGHPVMTAADSVRLMKRRQSITSWRASWRFAFLPSL